MVTKKYLFLGLFCFLLTQSAGRVLAAEETATPPSGANPEQTVLNFLQAVKTRDYRSAYQLLSVKDRDVMDLREFRGEAEERYSFLILFAKEAEISVSKKEISGNKAVVRVQITAPDEEQALTDTVLKSLDEDLQGEISDLLEMNESQPEEKRIRKQNYELRREREGWKIYLDWARQQAAADLLEQAEASEQNGQLYEAGEFYKQAYTMQPSEKIAVKIQAMEKMQTDGTAERKSGHVILGEARALEKAGKYTLSEQRYRQVLERDPELLQAKLGIDRIQGKKERAARDILLKDIEVKNLVSRGMSVTGKIKNMGVLALGQIRMRADFLDEKGQVIYTEKFFPVWKSAWAFGEKKKPLRSKQARSFVLSARKAPPSWNKQVEVILEGVEFAE